MLLHILPKRARCEYLGKIVLFQYMLDNFEKNGLKLKVVNFNKNPFKKKK